MTRPIQHLVLGITGGIAAYKSAELVRLLGKAGISVQVVMTPAAAQFITAPTLQALSGRPVHQDMWDGRIANGMPHIELSRKADAILVAPATADFIAKLAQGGADDLLSTLCLARECPLLVAPAMNRQMWENPATQRNVQQLQADGITVLGPAAGEQACGEVGLGRMLEPEIITAELQAWQQPKLFSGKRILLTAGPTIEAIDPVRGLTNFSSGKMGYAIAQAAAEMGAEVTLVSGPTALETPRGCRRLSVISAQQMADQVQAELTGQDVFISVAAVADYKPASPAAQKIKKSQSSLTLELAPNIDILAKVAKQPNPPFCVGFAAETEQLLEFAEQKRRQKNLPLIVANLANEAMGKDHTTVTLLDDHGEHRLPSADKLTVARALLRHIATMLDDNR